MCILDEGLYLVPLIILFEVFLIHIFFQILFHHRLLQDIEYIYTRYRIYRIYPYAYSRFVLLIYFIYSSLAK